MCVPSYSIFTNITFCIHNSFWSQIILSLTNPFYDPQYSKSLRIYYARMVQGFNNKLSQYDFAYSITNDINNILLFPNFINIYFKFKKMVIFCYQNNSYQPDMGIFLYKCTVLMGIEHLIGIIIDPKNELKHVIDFWK